MLESTFEADKHNFGKTVELVERASEKFFRKPRSVFWEHLFFGTQSPLKTFFEEHGENRESKLSNYLFNLEVVREHDWLGFSKAVLPTQGPLTEEHWYSFGVILAYTFLFGIRDLHKFNLVKAESHLQIIDVEVVLANLTLPNETVLLPFKDVSLELSAVSHLTENLSDVPSSSKQILLAGYFDLFGLIYKKSDEARSMLESSIQMNAPVRVILRNTGVYRNILSGDAGGLNLLPEEKTQLDRGDIPYFFKYLGSDALFWITSPNQDAAAVENFEEFAADVKRHACLPSLLVKDKDSIERKMVQGALLLQKLFVDAETRDYSWNGKKLTLNTDGCHVEYTGRKFLHKARQS